MDATDDEYATFRNDSEIETLDDFLARCRRVGHGAEWLERSSERLKRVRRPNIWNPFELRCALRELLPLVVAEEGDSPVVLAEKELIGKKLPGFFPTPRSIVHRMVDEANILKGHRVLEPSCGKGDILDVLFERHEDANITGLEFNRTLADVLDAKGYLGESAVVEFGDFLRHNGTYERIVMNPPFECGADCRHVRHAYSLLAPGGRVVAIMSEGPFFREQRESREFRTWLEHLGGRSEQLPEGAFAGHDAFRQTDARARIVTINREC